MKYKLATTFAILGWTAVLAQYFLMVENRNASILETTIQFFSFFTILTNTLVALYFTSIVFAKNKKAQTINPGILTSITAYIIIVGFVYQIVLRKIWQPQGLQLIINELLHSIVPILVIIYWSAYEKTRDITYSQIIKWQIYPFIYLIYILIRGYFSNFYLYPFVNVTTIGLKNVLINSFGLLILFTFTSAIFIFIGKSTFKR